MDESPRLVMLRPLDEDSEVVVEIEPTPEGDAWRAVRGDDAKG